MDDIIFAGIYSQKYKKLYDNLKNDFLQFVPEDNIQYKEIEQSVFDVRRNDCKWCGKGKICPFVFHTGEDCKIRYQTKIYEKYLNTNKIIIFTDVDVSVNKKVFKTNIFKLIEMLKDTDLVYQQEGSCSTNRWVSNINIGLTVSFSNDNILSFYQRTLDEMHVKKEWDQQVVNHILKNDKSLSFKLVPNNFLFNHTRRGGRA